MRRGHRRLPAAYPHHRICWIQSPAQGAATPIHVAAAPDLAPVTGRYFTNSKPKRSSKRSYAVDAAARLWQVSADLVGLTAGLPAAAAHPPTRAYPKVRTL